MCAFNSIALGFINFSKCNGAPLYLIVHVCMWSTTVWKFDKIHALLEHHYRQSYRWTTTLCTVPNLEYNAWMTIWRDDTSSIITFFNFAWVDVVTSSPPYLPSYNSLAIHSFFTIKKRTLELVSSIYALVASSNAARCLHMLDTITHSSKFVIDVWSSRVDTLRDFTTLCCASFPPDCLQGYQCLLGCLGPSLLLDAVKLVDWSLGGKAWGQCIFLT